MSAPDPKRTCLAPIQPREVAAFVAKQSFIVLTAIRHAQPDEFRADFEIYGTQFEEQIVTMPA
jgi:hypothetical protein